MCSSVLHISLSALTWFTLTLTACASLSREPPRVKHVVVEEEPCCTPIDREAMDACHARKCSYGAELICMGVDAPDDHVKAPSCSGPCVCTCAEDFERCAATPSAAPQGEAMATKKSSIEKLAMPSITAVATRMLSGHMLRAVARDWPGGSPDLYLERIDFGDEADPYVVVKQTKIAYNGERIETMRFDEDGVHFSSGERNWFVRASSEAFAEKAIRDE